MRKKFTRHPGAPLEIGKPRVEDGAVEKTVYRIVGGKLTKVLIREAAARVEQGKTFIPAATGQVITLDPDNADHRAIFGEELCDAVKAAQERGIVRNKYVQVVQPPEAQLPK